MTDVTQRLYSPALGRVYETVAEFAEPILRIALGGTRTELRHVEAAWQAVRDTYQRLCT